MNGTVITAGIDVGSSCAKVVIYDGHAILGSAVVPVRGLYEDCSREAISQALDDAQMRDQKPVLTCSTGFAADCVPWPCITCSMVSCLTAGAFSVFPQAMSLVDLGGQDPKVITIDENGTRTEVVSLRKCAAGSGVFLELVARRLDIHPSRLQSLAGNASRPAPIGSYCSVFALGEVDERLRDGASPAEVAAGAIESVAERIFESGGFVAPVMVSGGVAEYYPEVLRTLARLTGKPVKALPEPITIGALGAAIKAHQNVLEGDYIPDLTSSQ